MSGPGAVRVTGGELRGRALRVPAGARPTGARLREALFSIWGARVEGARFLDLFAGSGAVGIEALSRGAERVLLIESASGALRLLRENLRDLDLEERSELLALDLSGSSLSRIERLTGGAFDLVFADPPYAFAEWSRLLGAVAPLLGADGELAAEHPAKIVLCEAAGELRRVTTRKYGESALTFYRPSSARLEDRERRVRE